MRHLVRTLLDHRTNHPPHRFPFFCTHCFRLFLVSAVATLGVTLLQYLGLVDWYLKFLFRAKTPLGGGVERSIGLPVGLRWLASAGPAAVAAAMRVLSHACIVSVLLPDGFPFGGAPHGCVSLWGSVWLLMFFCVLFFVSFYVPT